MKKYIKFLISVSVFAVIFSVSVFAITENEVQNEVSRIGREGVTGNIFVWFLCAVAFLKVSQKIDSFMSSLGINVGHTGGSMLAEALITAKSIGSTFRGGGKSVSAGKSNGTSVNTAAFKGGLSGMVGRGITGNAVKNANGTKNGGIGGKIFDSSLAKGGGFANRVIGNIANGDIGTVGTISGENAGAAFMSYLGFTALGENAEDVPSFNNVEIGGGRITGTEISDSNPQGIKFAMYSADKYSAPEDNYLTVTAADGTAWYKQYAENTIVQKPFVHSDGYVDRGDTVEKRIPKAAKRKDRQ